MDEPRIKERKCTACGIIKNWRYFYPNRSDYTYGYANECKRCSKERDRARYFKKKLKLPTVEEFRDMLEDIDLSYMTEEFEGTIKEYTRSAKAHFHCWEVALRGGKVYEDLYYKKLKEGGYSHPKLAEGPVEAPASPSE